MFYNKYVYNELFISPKHQRNPENKIYKNQKISAT